MATGEKWISFSGSNGANLIGDVSPKNKWLAAERIFSNAITLWDIARQMELRTLPKLDARMSEVAFSRCNSFVGVSCKSGLIVIWEVESGVEVNRVTKEGATLAGALELMKQ